MLIVQLFLAAALFVGLLVSAEAQVCAFPDKPWKCCNASSIDSCPIEGCGGDSKLNLRKNVVEIPEANEIEDWKFNDMLNVTFPAEWSSGQDRALLTTWGEGKAIRLSVRLKKVVNYSSGKESTTCSLKRNENNDFHLVLTRVKNKPESQSITAEITPRIRPTRCTLTKLRQLAAEQYYVRITGYLMLDTQHIGDDHPIRYTHWEIHPVTAFEACTMTKVACDNGEGWQALEDWPEP